MVPHAFGARLGRAALAEGVRRDGREPERADHPDRGTGAGRGAADTGAGPEPYRPDPDEVRHRRAEGQAPAADRSRRCDMGARLLRAGLGLRSRKPDDAGGPRRRQVHRERAENLADLGPPFRLDVHAGAHRSERRAQAGRHQLPVGRPQDAGHPDPADRHHRRRRRAERKLLRRRRGARGKPGRRIARRLGDRERSAVPRAAVDRQSAIRIGGDGADRCDRPLQWRNRRPGVPGPPARACGSRSWRRPRCSATRSA